jgi:hypothetical protein
MRRRGSRQRPGGTFFLALGLEADELRSGKLRPKFDAKRQGWGAVTTKSGSVEAGDRCMILDSCQQTSTQLSSSRFTAHLKTN